MSDGRVFRALSSVTLGVADLGRARAFYDALGLIGDPASSDDYVIYRLGSLALSLFPTDKLAADAGVANDGHGFGGVTFAHDFASADEVDAAMAVVLAAGGTLSRPAQTVFWGGYSGFVADPDGHLWELVFNPFA
jgi:uncharacterized protein